MRLEKSVKLKFWWLISLGLKKKKKAKSINAFFQITCLIYETEQKFPCFNYWKLSEKQDNVISCFDEVQGHISWNDWVSIEKTLEYKCVFFFKSKESQSAELLPGRRVAILK